MPYDLFYEGHAWLTTSYKKAYRLRREQANFDAFLQGAYVYEAMVRCAPAYNPFIKGAKLQPWLSEPFPIAMSSDRERKIREEERKAEREKAGIAFMQSFAAAHNAKLSKKPEADGTPKQDSD